MRQPTTQPVGPFRQHRDRRRRPATRPERLTHHAGRRRSRARSVPPRWVEPSHMRGTFCAVACDRLDGRTRSEACWSLSTAAHILNERSDRGPFRRRTIAFASPSGPKVSGPMWPRHAPTLPPCSIGRSVADIARSSDDGRSSRRMHITSPALRRTRCPAKVRNSFARSAELRSVRNGQPISPRLQHAALMGSRSGRGPGELHAG